jgi:hypothetical protein
MLWNPWIPSAGIITYPKDGEENRDRGRALPIIGHRLVEAFGEPNCDALRGNECLTAYSRFGEGNEIES